MVDKQNEQRNYFKVADLAKNLRKDVDENDFVVCCLGLPCCTKQRGGPLPPSLCTATFEHIELI